MLIPYIFLFSIVLFFFLSPTSPTTKKEEKKKNPEEELADAIAKYMSQTKKT